MRLMTMLWTQDELDRAVDVLARSDVRLAAVVERHGRPKIRRMAPALESLLRIVTDQLISLKAGEAIWRRIEERFFPLDAASLSNTSEADLRAAGLSGAKARTFIAAARQSHCGGLDFEKLAGLEDEQIRTCLLQIPGIGPWTADIFLLFALGRANAWPAGDVALQAAAQSLLGLPHRPQGRAMTTLAAPWMPWRGAAAHILWSHYRGLKGLPQAE